MRKIVLAATCAAALLAAAAPAGAMILDPGAARSAAASIDLIDGVGTVGVGTPVGVGATITGTAGIIGEWAHLTRGPRSRAAVLEPFARTSALQAGFIDQNSRTVLADHCAADVAAAWFAVPSSRAMFCINRSLVSRKK
jgi:hypothetical protein